MKIIVTLVALLLGGHTITAQIETPTTETNQEVFIGGIHEIMPRFPGCEDLEGTDSDKKKCSDEKLLAFVYKNFVSPIDAAGNTAEGMAVVSFTITKTGELTNINLARDPGNGIGAEAVRVVKLIQAMPERWTPAKQRAQVVAVRYHLPIRSKSNAVVKKLASPSEQTVLYRAEAMPRFPGCEDLDGTDHHKKQCADEKLLHFVYDNFVPPTDSKGNTAEGVAVVSFLVTQTGRVTNIKLLRDPGNGIGEEAMRVVKLMQALPEPWIPGLLQDRPIDVPYNLPIHSRAPN